MNHPLPPLPIKTERLLLRRPSPYFADDVQEAIEETFEDLRLWMPWAKEIQPLEDTREFLATSQRRFADGQDFVVLGFLRESGAFVLSTGLHPRNWDVPSFEIGYWCRQSMQGRGYVSEAVNALTEIAFREMSANRVEIRCDSRNLRSRRVAERAGYRMEAELHSDSRANDGSLRNTLIYVMLAEDFWAAGRNDAGQQPAGRTDPKRVVEQGYDRVAGEYARLEGESQWPRMRWLRKVLDRLEPGSSVLDLGCGSGEPADVEIAKEHQVTGVDISQAQIDLARRNVPTGHFLHGDAASAEFPAGSFDAVVSFYTLEHIPRQEHAAVLRRIGTWLRAGGLLLLSMEAEEYDDVMGEWLGVPMFISSYGPDPMKRMVEEAGFELLETAIESQLERDTDIPYLWVLGQKR